MRHRSRRGGSIAEFGPALIILFLFLFFPVLDLLVLGAKYGIVWYFNDQECRLLSSQSINAATMVTGARTDQTPGNPLIGPWQASGMGQFLGAKTSDYKVYLTLNKITSTSLIQATVTSTVTVTPFMTIPFPLSIPGLNQPLSLTVQATRPTEIVN